MKKNIEDQIKRKKEELKKLEAIRAKAVSEDNAKLGALVVKLFPNIPESEKDRIKFFENIKKDGLKEFNSSPSTTNSDEKEMSEF